MTQCEYVGTELELFAEARNWKRYLRDAIAPFLGGDVLEVGAGIGTTTRALCTGHVFRLTAEATGAVSSWTCLEPDPALAATLERESLALPCSPRVVVGTLADLPETARFDSLLYVDVLEHIEHDAAEVQRAAARLNQGGRLIILCPAHQALYSAFDRQIGHFRRYDRKMMRALTPEGMTLERLTYLDSAGFLLSTANRLLLRASMPTRGQIHTWDRLFVPISRVTDVLTGGRVGKSILAVWRKTASR